MGQIANQMLIDWCCKMAQKRKDKKQDKKDRKQISEKASEKRDIPDKEGKR